MSKFACPERRLSCGKGCANALLPEARKHLPNWGPRRRSGHFGPRSILREPGTAARVRSLLVSAQPCLSRARRQSAGTVQRKAIIGFPKARPRERDQPACASAPSSILPELGRQEVQRHSKNQIHHQYKHPDKPRRECPRAITVFAQVPIYAKGYFSGAFEISTAQLTSA